MKSKNLQLFSICFILFISIGFKTSNGQSVLLANNGGQVGAAFVSQGATNWLMHRAQVTVSGPGATAITSLSCILSGTYLASDLVNIKLWYSLDNTFKPGSCILVSTLTNPGTGGTKTFPAFTPVYLPDGTLQYNADGYIYITADFDVNATVGKGILVNNLSNTNITLNAGIISGSTSPGGIQTIADGVLADNAPQVSSSNVSPGATDVLLHRSSISTGITARTVTGMTCTTAGNYIAGDITNLKVYFSSSSTFTLASSTLLSTLISPATAGTMFFPSFVSQLIPANTRGYFYITADVATGATVSNNIKVNALTGSNFTCTPTAISSGITTASSNQIFTAATATFSDNAPQVVSGNAMQGATNVVLHQSILSYSAFLRWSEITFSTSGNYTAADVTNIKIWSSSSPTFSVGTAGVMASIPGPGPAGGKIFPIGINQSSSGTLYFYITADIAPTATIGHTISVDAMTSANIKGLIGAISGSATSGGIQTITAGTAPLCYLSDNGTQVQPGNTVQGAKDVLLHQSGIYSGSGFAEITALNCTIGGSYSGADVTSLKLYFSTSGNFNIATATLVSTLSSPGAAGPKTFPSFIPQYVLDQANGYFFITVDISSSATIGNTISLNALTTTDFTINSGSMLGGSSGGGLKTIVLAPSIVISDNSPQIIYAGAPLGSVNWVCHKSKLTITNANTTLTGMSCFISGTAPSQAFKNLRVYYSTNSVFNAGASTLLSTMSSPGNGGTVVFTSFTPQPISSGATAYIYITADVQSVVNNRSIIIGAMTPSNFTFDLDGLKATGYASAAGEQVCCHIALTDDDPQTVAAYVPQASTVVLHQSALNEGTSLYLLTGLSCNTNGTYQAADITNLQAWWQSTPVFTGSGTLLSTINNPTGAGSKTFPAFSVALVPTSSTSYVFITADISPMAVIGRTVGVNALAPNNFTTTGGDLKGATTKGGVDTIVTSVNVFNIRGNEILFSIYPNPATNELWVMSDELWDNSKAVTVELNNILGENVYHSQLITHNSKLRARIDVSSLAKGVYILQLNSDNKSYQTKVLVE